MIAKQLKNESFGAYSAIKMFSLPDELLVSVLADWTGACGLCRIGCSGKNAKSLEKLFKHAGFVLKPDEYLSDACLAWLSSKGIKVVLKKEYEFDYSGMQTWRVNGNLDRDNDLPAIIWHQNGQQHRENDLPTLQIWCRHGKRHRDNDLPAVIYAIGDRYWFQHGKCHRDNDLPAIVNANGDQRWYQNGECHRNNGLPAVIHPSGSKGWYQHGEFIKSAL